MSYSFNIKAATKAAAKEAVVAKFDESVVAQQPIHARDRDAVLANANAAIDLMGDDDSKDVQVSCNGYLSWNGSGEWSPETAAIGTVAISCSVGYVPRVAPHPVLDAISTVDAPK